MNFNNQWKRLLVGGAAALTLTAGAIWAVDGVSAAVPTAVFEQIGIQKHGEGEFGRGGRGHKGGRMHQALGERQQYLAAALGITVEELQSAYETVRNSLLDQAVADGTLTQEQADQIRAGERVRVPGLRMKGRAGDAAEHVALLASTLGISVDELEAAKSVARDAALADALANGEITQEQIDRMEAHQALRDYIQSEYAAERPELTKAELIQQALAAGAITQEQADLLTADEGRMGPGRGRGSKGRGFGGWDFPGRQMPGENGGETQPNLDEGTDDTTNIDV